MERIPKPPHGSADWLRLRQRDTAGRCRLAASEAPALMGDSPWTSRAQLFAAKFTEPEPSAPSAAMAVGNALEPALVQELGRRLGVPFVTPDEMFVRGRWIMTADAVAYWPDGTVAAVGEVKTTRRHRVATLADVPAEYLWQVWAQQYVTGAPTWLAVLDRNLDISVLEVPRNDRALEALEAAGERFAAAVDGDDVFALGAGFDELTAADVAALYRPSERVAELPPAALDWIADLTEARALRRQSEVVERRAKDALARLLLDAEVGTIDGAPAVTWRTSEDTVGAVDVERLALDYPQLVERYRIQRQPRRVMRVVLGKGKQ